ncbi:lysophospholipid acyltransferase family protein [Ramlibacter sp. H39-3-26]|uniref:lysophospholipid acyltransferase family protein n=1 Tax=Curvibacter soli TaxID=3031331 RepID=UPI0023DAE0E6|nr:lysophospholipid acyltransferase family protein [Ramlibacter sp. H39-3-26]MDF1483747.1 lysophospholipid acyltransferase family protein [Ramlibacter sp. H39-3-26]
MPLVFRLFSLCPLWLLHGMGALLGWAAFLASPGYRARFLANARQAGYGFAEVRAGVAHAGRMAAELPRLWFGARLPYAWDDPGLIARAYEAGRGIVFLTPHIGCFEISPQAAAYDYGARHGPITILYRPARKAWLARVMAGARTRAGLQAVPTTLAGVRQMVRALRRGQAVGLLPDQVPPAGQGVWAPFFGRDAYTMTLAARLALQTGAAVLLAWVERLPRARGFVVHVRGLGAPLAGDTAQAAAQLNREMERIIRQCPQQYLWGYARYKAPRGDAPGEAA